jgi:hypothetical protein
MHQHPFRPASVKARVLETQSLRIADLEFYGQILGCSPFSCRNYHVFTEIDADHTPTTAYQSGEFEGVVAESTTGIEHRFTPLQLQASENDGFARNDARNLVCLLKEPFEEVRLLGLIDCGEELISSELVMSIPFRLPKC